MKIETKFKPEDIVWRVFYTFRAVPADVSVCRECGHRDVNIKPAIKTWIIAEATIESLDIRVHENETEVEYVFGQDYEGNNEWSVGEDIFATKQEAQAEADRRNSEEEG